ncbi:MAG: signal recognition particle protein [Deltaproteobacteria bacterium]|nr:signal recognition particle protein [Deltaproteobacteria bacterium]
MFDSLTDKLNLVFKKLKGHGKLSEENIQVGLKEVKMALLEADVHYKVVKDFINAVKDRAIGQEVLASLTPGQQMIKIVNEELTRVMGETFTGLRFPGDKPAVIMLVGLQGSGKTTTAGKLAKLLSKDQRQPYLVPVDIYRPAAIEQLQTLGAQLGVRVFASTPEMDPVEICRNGVTEAVRNGCNTIILDTAGRLHIDQTMMGELIRIREAVKPAEILLVADAMTGQDAITVAKSFNEALNIDGIILTKMDGDARGGAAISMRTITEKPIKFIGVGEKLDALEVFHPDRMASRILGMGDVLTFIEKAQTSIDEKKARLLEKKLRKNQFTLEDFRDQMVQIRKMGSMEQILGMIPGMGKMKQLKGLKVDDRELVKTEAIINSMTPKERQYYTIINGSRRKRIARGSGTSVQNVNRLLKNYTQALKMIKKLNKGGFAKMGRGMLPF